MKRRTDYIGLDICNLVYIKGAYKSFIFSQWSRKQGLEEGRSVGEKCIGLRKEKM